MAPPAKDLVDAAAAGDTAELLQLLAAGTPVDAVNEAGDTALMAAAANGQMDALKELLKAGAEVDVLGYDSITALIIAAATGHADAVKELLAAKASVDATTDFGKTALWFAAAEGHADVVRELLAARADTEAADNTGKTALHEAAAAGHVDIVQQLVDAGASVGAAIQDSVTLSDIGYTALMLAARKGRTAVVRQLLAAKAPVNATAENCATALWLTAAGGHLDIVRELRAAGASLEATCDIEADGMEAFTALMAAALEGKLDVVQELLKLGAEVNAATEHGTTALVLAAVRGHMDVVHELLVAGASACGTFDKEYTFLEHAAHPAALLAAVYAVQGPSAAAALLQATLGSNSEGADPDELKQLEHAANTLLELGTNVWLDPSNPGVQATQQLADALRLLSLLEQVHPAAIVSSARALVAAAAEGDKPAVLQLLSQAHFAPGAPQEAAAAAVKGSHLALSLLLVRQLVITTDSNWDLGAVCDKVPFLAMLEALLQVWRDTPAPQQCEAHMQQQQVPPVASKAHQCSSVLVKAALAHQEMRACSECQVGHPGGCQEVQRSTRGCCLQ